jgi:hypothetical protein
MMKTEMQSGWKEGGILHDSGAFKTDGKSTGRPIWKQLRSRHPRSDKKEPGKIYRIY